MSILPEHQEYGNRVDFVGVTGIGPHRQTKYGLAVNMADNRQRPCKWCDVIPINVEAGQLQPRTRYRVRGVVVEDGDRPLIICTVEPI